MRDVLGPGTSLGYCTNVHAGATLEESLANLRTHGADVRAIACPGERMGVGWWLSSASLGRGGVADGRAAPELRRELESLGLEAFTMNGFPYGDFHQPVVKHRVYEPDWADPRRLDYTLALAELLAAMAEGPCERSISTLPIGWPAPPAAPIDLARAAAHLLDAVETLARLESDTGVLVHLDLEPEPGCVLQRSHDVTDLFVRHLVPAAGRRGVGEEPVRRHLRVCHDVCHAAVMFEGQAAAIAEYRDHGVAVGKVQVSSAIRVDFDAMAAGDRPDAAARLREFAEDRYLHQTGVRTDDGACRFFEDLPLALAAIDPADGPRGEWRVHFHVPLFLDRFGPIETTQSDVLDCFRAIRPADGVRHFEAETYAWGVLPGPLRSDSLADGIARELTWVREQARVAGMA